MNYNNPLRDYNNHSLDYNNLLLDYNNPIIIYYYNNPWTNINPCCPVICPLLEQSNSYFMASSLPFLSSMLKLTSIISALLRYVC